MSIGPRYIDVAAVELIHSVKIGSSQWTHCFVQPQYINCDGRGDGILGKASTEAEKKNRSRALATLGSGP